MLSIVLVLILTMSGAGLSLANPGEGKTITMGKASWTSTEPKAAVFVLLLEELGYRVNEPILFASNPIGYLSILQGDIDFWPSGWFPSHYSHLPRNFERNASIVGTVCEGCGMEGFLVDIPSIEKYNIKTIEDFKRPEVKAAFDATGDGKADLFGCPAGWGCHEILEYYMDAYDLRPHMNHIQADYTATFADAYARIRAGEPTLYYTWAPNDTILLLVPGEDVKWIGVPHVDRGPAHESFEDEDLIAHGLEDAVSDPITLGFVPNDIRVVANNRFLDANPAAKALFEQVELSLTWISEATLRISEGESSYQEILAIGREWIEENRDLVDTWLDEARAAAQ